MGKREKENHGQGQAAAVPGGPTAPLHGAEPWALLETVPDITPRRRSFCKRQEAPAGFPGAAAGLSPLPP